jgi:biotin carboxylase
MKKKRILILGASRYYSKSIEAVRQAGYYVIVADAKPDSPGFAVADHHIVRNIVDEKGVFDDAKKLKVDAIIPVNDYGVPSAAYACEKLGLPGISVEASRLSTNKELMVKAWVSSGVRCPKYIVAEKPDEIRLAIAEIGFPCILKPAHGHGGASRGVVVVRNTEDIIEAINFCRSFYSDKTTLIGEFINSSSEHSAEVLVYNGKCHLIAVADKVKTPLPYRVDKNVLYPSKLTEKEIKKLKHVISNVVFSLGISIGVTHVEFASKDGDFIFFELGARCGGGGTPEPIVPFVTGVQEFVEQVRILSGDEPVKLSPDKKMACNYHFITPSPGIIKNISISEKIRDFKELLDFDIIVKPGDVINQVKTGIDRAGFAIIGEQTRDNAMRIGAEIEDLVEFEYI